MKIQHRSIWLSCAWVFFGMGQSLAETMTTSTGGISSATTPEVTRSRRSLGIVVHHKKEKAIIPIITPSVRIPDNLNEPKKIQTTAKKKIIYIDEKPIWKLVHEGKINAAKRAIAGAKKRKSGWQASSDLRRAIVTQYTEQQLNKNTHKEAWQATVLLHVQHLSRFDCGHAYRRLYVNTALIKLNKLKQAEALYADTLKHCDAPSRVAALEHASGRLPSSATARLLIIMAQQKLPKKLQPRIDALAFHYWVQRGQKKDASPEVLTRLRSMMSRLKELKRADIHESLAWLELKFNHPEQALKQFRISRLLQDNDSALKGEVIALHATKQAKAMRALMLEEQLRLDHMKALPNLLPLLAAACGEEKNYPCQREAFRKIKVFRPLKPDEDEALTWIYYNDGQFGRAADNFERIYRITQSMGVAKGLFVSLMRLGQTDRASRLAEEYGGPFKAIISRGDAERFYMRKLFHAAQAYDESFDVSLKHLDADYARLSFMQRHRGGNTLEPVFNQFSQRKMVFEGGIFRDKKHRFFLRYEPTQLDIGQAIIPLGDNFGTNPIVPTPAIYPLQTRHTGYEWNVGYRYEDWLTWYGDIGQSFVHGRLKPTFKGHLGFKQEFLAGFVKGEIFRQPIRESMLSYVGMNDPFTNQSWGRVTRTGLQVNGYHLTGITDVGLTYLLRAEWMRGVAVQKNRHLLFNVFVPRHFQWFHGTEWSVGPLLQWESFANDQGHFMWGHGGYFSPQVNNYVGLNARFITREARTYNYEFRAFMGAQTYSTKTTPLLPFTPDGRNFLAQTIVEKMYQIQGKIIRDLPWNLQIGASFAWSDAIYSAPAPVLYNNYRELLMSVFLTWQPEDRNTTMSSDHPLFGINTLY